MIVSDAGPIIIFTRIARLDLLKETLDSLLVPDAVYEEIVVNKGGMPGAEGVAQAAWIQRTAVAKRAILESLPRGLHEGEREAIALARELEAQLLVDEVRARRVARDLGIEVIGTLRCEATRTHHSRGADRRPDAIKRLPIRARPGSTVPRPAGRILDPMGDRPRS